MECAARRHQDARGKAADSMRAARRGCDAESTLQRLYVLVYRRVAHIKSRRYLLCAVLSFARTSSGALGATRVLGATAVSRA